MNKAEEAALKAYPHYTAENLDDVIKARKFFVKGYEQAEKDLNKKPSDDLDEAAYKYSFESRPSVYGQVDVIDAFKAGAEWQKKQQ